MNEPNRKIRAAIYLRVSTLLGQSLDNQRIPLQEFAKSRGFEIVLECSDEGISGTRERRPGLDHLLAKAKFRAFDVVIVAALDRISRSTRHAIQLLEELHHYGIHLISLRENLDFTSPTGQMALTCLMAVATLERQIISERIRQALAAKKLAAQRTGTAWRPGRPTVVTEEIIAQVQELRQTGLSIRDIAKRLQISKASVQRALEAVPVTSIPASKKSE